MDEKEIKTWIEKGESETLELKPSLSQINAVIETLSALSNTSGGRILMGISNSGGRLGVQIGEDTIERLTNKIASNTEPKVYPKISVEDMEGKKIIVIEVKEAVDKPVLAFGRAFKRVGKSTLRISKHEYESMILEKRKVYWDEQICEGARLEDIDAEKVKWFLRKAKHERNFDGEPETPVMEALERLELVKQGKLTHAAVLLFGKNPQKFFLQAETRCARFKGTKAVKPFLDMKVLRGPGYEQIDEAEKFVLNHIRRAAWTVPGQVERVEQWEYPPDAIREAVTNAIAHRDYFSTANVHISIFDDRIEVWNPGKLPEPLTPDDLKRTHKSIPVNPLLASTLFLIKYIEKWGSGTNDIVKWCLDYELPEPIFREEAGGFAVILRRSKILEELEELDLNERQKIAVEHIKRYGRITNRDYQKLCEGVSRKTLARDLQDLVEKDIVERKGQRKGVYYVFK